jgi:hypothetical protein
VQSRRFLGFPHISSDEPKKIGFVPVIAFSPL